MRRAYSAADCGKQAGISSDMGSPVEYVAISNHRHLRSKLKGIPVSDRALQWGVLQILASGLVLHLWAVILKARNQVTLWATTMVSHFNFRQ